MNSKINLETFLKLVKENEKILVTRGYEQFNDNEFYCGECKEFLKSNLYPKFKDFNIECVNSDAQHDENWDPESLLVINLLPKCEFCGSESSVTFRNDPWADEIYNDKTNHWICEKCVIDKLDDI